MADHNAHTYFGLRVLEQLPADLRTHVSGDMPAFHLGLYGPDPLIFSLLTKHISDRLHKNWRTESLPGLSKALQKGSATARSFAGGYVLHQLLDDTVHPQIYQWMEEGSSHFRVEIALDLLLLEEKRQANSPKVRTEGKDRTALAAAGMLAPLGARAYLSGLWRMATLSNPQPGAPPGPGTPGPDGGADRPGGPGIGKNPGSDSQPGRQPQARAAPVPHRAAPGRTTAPGRPSPYACGGVSPTHLPTTDPACRRFPGCRVFFCPGGQDMGLSGRTNRGQRV